MRPVSLAWRRWATLGLVTVGVAGACQRATREPARILAGQADTVVVNHRGPMRLPVRVLDAAGRVIAETGVRFAWASGDPVAISPHGEVKCARQADARVRARVGHVTATFLVRCRPVETLRFHGPIQLVVGDTAQRLPVAAYGADNRKVELLDATVWVGDTSIVELDGQRVRPRRWGASILSVSVGDRSATTGVHVYEPVTTLDGLAQDPRLIAVPLRLAPGEMRRWFLPRGSWMLSMWPEADSGLGPMLRVEGARCTPVPGLSRRRFSCSVTGTAAVIVYVPWRAGAAIARTDTLAIKPSGEMEGRTRRQVASRAQVP